MKKILFLIAATLIGFCKADAQLIKTGEERKVEAKYLAGAVPVKDGHVVFSRSIALPDGLDADDAYKKALAWVGEFYKHEDVLTRKNNNSNIEEHLVSAGIVEYLTFKRKALVLDRTQIIYMLDIKVNGKVLDVRMYNISYYYDEERDKLHYAAENLITDDKALNKKGTKLFAGDYKKFRMKTIDHFDAICNSIAATVR